MSFMAYRDAGLAAESKLGEGARACPTCEKLRAQRVAPLRRGLYGIGRVVLYFIAADAALACAGILLLAVSDAMVRGPELGDLAASSVAMAFAGGFGAISFMTARRFRPRETPQADEPVARELAAMRASCTHADRNPMATFGYALGWIGGAAAIVLAALAACMVIVGVLFGLFFISLTGMNFG
jgi:hypothetical protein